MRTFNIGIVGAGAIVRQVHLPVLRNIVQARVAWVTDADEGRARAVARAYRVPSVPLPASPADLPPADVVLLAIPVGYRTPYYEALARRETAVFAEKPFAVTGAEHERLLALYPPHALACGYMRRTYATTELFRRAVAERWFGDLQRIRIAEGARTTRTGVDSSHYDNVQAAGGGVLMTLGCHGLDLALYITGATEYRILNSNLEFDGDIERKVEAAIRLAGPGGRDGGEWSLDFCVSWLDDQDNVIELEFPQIRLTAGLVPGSSVQLRPKGVVAGPGQEMQLGRGARTPNQAFFLEWDWFLHGLEEGRTCPVAACTALRTASLMDALYGKEGVAA